MIKKTTKADRARALIAEGKTIEQIAAILGVTRQYVYSLRYVDKKKSKGAKKLKPVLTLKKRGPGRPKGSKNKSKSQAETKVNPYLPQPSPLTQPLIMEYIAPTPPYGFMDRIRILFTGRA